LSWEFVKKKKKRGAGTSRVRGGDKDRKRQTKKDNFGGWGGKVTKGKKGQLTWVKRKNQNRP